MVVRSALSAERRCGAFASNLRRPPAKLSSARVASIRTPRFMTIMVLNQNPFDSSPGSRMPPSVWCCVGYVAPAVMAMAACVLLLCRGIRQFE
jgi:hypothetical protein